MSKNLFTPGPLNTSDTVKQAMLRDLGSRDAEFMQIVADIRTELLNLGHVSHATGHEAIPMQGSGTFGIESVIGSVVPRGGKLLVLVNGAYGERIVRIAARLGIETETLSCAENETHDLEQLHELLGEDADITDVAVVHCETSSGVLNPVERIGALVHEFDRTFIVDAMSSFGGIPLHIAEATIDYLISSSNKCIEGVPGFSFVIARRAHLLGTREHARSISLDLLAQWETLERTGQFRFTPPTHALLAFAQALQELRDEGGVPARHRRYQRRHAALVAGMHDLSFREYVPRELQGPIITAFHYPADPAFQFEQFYEELSAHGHVIYPGKLTEEECFRIGNIGRLPETAIPDLLAAIGGYLEQHQIRVRQGVV